MCFLPDDGWGNFDKSAMLSPGRTPWTLHVFSMMGSVNTVARHAQPNVALSNIRKVGLSPYSFVQLKQGFFVSYLEIGAIWHMVRTSGEWLQMRMRAPIFSLGLSLR